VAVAVAVGVAAALVEDDWVASGLASEPGDPPAHPARTRADTATKAAGPPNREDLEISGDVMGRFSPTIFKTAYSGQ
jgi:hypothetical protein